MVHQNSTVISYPFFFPNCFPALVKDISQRNEKVSGEVKGSLNKMTCPKLREMREEKTFMILIKHALHWSKLQKEFSWSSG